MDEDGDVPMILAKKHSNDELLDHIILPRVLSQEKSSKLYDTELELMKKMVETVENMANSIPPKTVELFQRLYDVHMNCTKENVSHVISFLAPGDTFAMFVRLQHTGIMIHVPSNEKIGDIKNVIVSTIPTIHPGVIYDHDSDYEFNYPEQAIEVNFSQIMKSEEFAHQLCILYETLPIEETKRNCVSKWLITLLANDENLTAATKYPTITKKIRDEILGSSKTNYFRRSSFYMGIKVMLQHNLTLQLGAADGKWLYKVIMLKHFVNICAPYKEYATFNIDLLSQMIAKLARRIEKMPKVSKKVPNGIELAVIKEAKDAIVAIRQKIDEQINRLQQEIEKKAQLSDSTVSCKSGVKFKIPQLSAYIARRKKNVKTLNKSNNFTPKTYRRFFTKSSLNVESIEIRKTDIGDRVFWLEFEQMVLYDMKTDDNRWNDHELRKWSFAYAKYAEAKYEGIPLLVSRMLLVRLKLIAVLDQFVVKKYPLLGQHKSGINPSVINDLLIPNYEDMCIAYEIEKYFRQRNDQSQGPSLNGENSVSDRSFAVKYAKQNPQMQQVLQNILAADERNVKEKKSEWQRNREQSETYKREADCLKCEFYINAWGHRCHSFHCKRCNIQSKLSSLRIMQYERLLPSNEVKQLAIVFELQIPSEIANLQDVLNSFAEFCLGESEALKMTKDWIDRPDLKLYKANNGIERNVTLGSTTSENLGSFHVECSFDWFIVENTHDCVFHAEEQKKTPNTIPDDSVKNVCSFKALNEYAGLQWALENTHHTQNQVIAEQSRCCQELTLPEYKSYCSLRADGHRLQLRNLYTMIATESLSFEKESVLALIMQTLWECGVSGTNESVRESHIDFRDTKFCSAMIELLVKYVNQQRNNWVHPFKLLTVTLITIRAFEINCDDAVAHAIAKLLRLIRAVALEWITKIGYEIRHMVNPKKEIEQDLRMKLIHVAITGGMTFSVHPKHKNFELIFQDDIENGITALRAWLQFIVSLKNSVRMHTNDEAKLPPNTFMFLRVMECIGVHLESNLKKVVQRNPSEVYDLIKKQWSLAKCASFHLNASKRLYPHLLVIDVTISFSKKQVVTIDIITGSFLVDGFPLSRLPKQILKSESYNWFFKNVVFEVQPDGESFSTVAPINNCCYEFKLIDPIIITERTANDVSKELIDRKNLNGEFPHHLVENYSHWWNEKGNCIEFRKRAADDTHFSKMTDIDYLFDLDKLQLENVQTQLQMLDTKSDIFGKIIVRFSRLEHPKHILAFFENAHIVNVELLRMNLKFQINLKTKDWICKEFNGMRISLTQNVGTLYGLNHGLVLESQADANIKTILIPNGNVEMKRTVDHVFVRIKTEENLHSPPFYQYKVDELCRQLKSSDGSYSSWFYLAYLHAVTSHGETEPFTGLSGTERALQILQSAFAWSSSPYEPEATELLMMIADLTPLRTLNNDMQLVGWPDNIPHRSAQDCYLFIAKKLLEDSQRLCGLHTQGPSKPLKLATDMDLNVRDHWRCQSLNPNLNVSDAFMRNKQLKTVLPDHPRTSLCPKTRAVCISYHKNQCTVPTSLNLNTFLTNRRGKLTGIDTSANVGTCQEQLKGLLCHSVHEDFANLWISLYDAARKQLLNREQFIVILSYFAHHGEEINPILALQAVANNSNHFGHVNPPAVKSYPISDGGLNANVRKTKISEILRQNYNCPSEYHSQNWMDTSKRQKHDSDLAAIIKYITKAIEEHWPCDSFNLNFMSSHQFQHINYAQANIEINEQLERWHKNYQLDVFIKRVETHLRSLPRSILRGQAIELGIANRVPDIARNKTKADINYEVKLRNCFDALGQEAIDQAQTTWEMKTRESARSADSWWTLIQETISNSRGIDHLIKGGVFPRIIPSLFLPKLIEKNTGDDDDHMKHLIGAWAIEIARQQRQKRIEMYERLHSQESFLDKEKKHKPHTNWKPNDYPEWLLFEIEQNLTIRRIQIEIAKRMIAPPEIDIKHSVMQLNMGEGKTSVIVPLLAAKLADGMQACQITVLKPLFATNLKSLRQYLGGLLGQKVYVFPCRRDMPIEKYADSILHIYKECMEEKGVILTLPEYRLSFQLKIYETIQNEKKVKAKQLLAVHKWINKNVRNVLDESDEILQAKYQLVYTVGDQRQPDAGSQRWLVTQAVLKRVPGHMKDLYSTYGKNKIEFDENNYRADVFTQCRILDETVFEALKTKLIDDFLGRRIDIDFKSGTESKMEKLKHILTERAITRDEFLEIKRKFSEVDFNTILIVSGLLRFEVLKLALTKRWRVHYGVHDKGRRKMAIPFKAKDKAAETTEFGHPDVAVCFTQMSYYYSGLDDDQLYRVFEILENMSDAASTYEKWIEKIPFIDPSIQTYGGVNLDDIRQRDELLFPLFRFNMHVIDFYCNMVFSQELKIFDKKLMCSAWDLVSDHYTHKVTGFSGTNDTKNILPLTIGQNDLEELEQTNANMRQVLLHPRNTPYKNLPANVSGKQILMELVQLNIPVLLDSGALMLELNNKEVGIEWLKLAPKFRATVYFDGNDALQTIDRNGIVTAFDYSVYKGNLDKCLVYLDDAHTRGTDLRFPTGWKACVTLSGDISRDKTVQSCMRMRQLETSQSISFWASYEADIGIRKVCGLSPQAAVQNEHVIKFIEDNSRRFEIANMVHWATCALNYTKKLIAHKQYEDKDDIDDSMQNLYEKCVDDDFAKLTELYGEKEEAKLVKIAYKKFDKIAECADEKNIRKFVRNMQEDVDEKLKNFAPNVKRFTHALDEEQEKELEQEIEEQSQVERPPEAIPAKPKCHELLQKLVIEGANDTLIETMKEENVFVSIAASLANTQLSEFCSRNADAWSKNLLVTKDFQTVIERPSKSCDEFLRPIRWIAQFRSSKADNVLILLSSFEVNQLLPAFRESANSTLFMYHPRLSSGHSNLLHEEKLRVTGSSTPSAIDIKDEVQIAVYSGQMYFKDVAEHDAYCSFLGLIPTPRTTEQQEAYNEKIIKESGFVPAKKRKCEAVSNCVANCNFNESPTNFVIELIKTHHQLLLKNSHASSILVRGKRVNFKEDHAMEAE